MQAEPWAIGLVIFATLVGSLGPILLKFGSAKLKKDIRSIIFNVPLIAGIGCYGMSTIIFIPALKGGDLSVLYPLTALNYVWVSFLSIWILKEKMQTLKWIGIVLILIGVFAIGVGMG